MDHLGQQLHHPDLLQLMDPHGLLERQDLYHLVQSFDQDLLHLEQVERHDQLVHWRLLFQVAHPCLDPVDSHHHDRVEHPYLDPVDLHLLDRVELLRHVLVDWPLLLLFKHRLEQAL